MNTDPQILETLNKIERRLARLEETLCPITDEQIAAHKRAFAEANPDHEELIAFIIEQAERYKRSGQPWFQGVVEEIEKYGAPKQTNMNTIRSIRDIEMQRRQNENIE